MMDENLKILHQQMIEIKAISKKHPDKSIKENFANKFRTNFRFIKLMSEDNIIINHFSTDSDHIRKYTKEQYQRFLIKVVEDNKILINDIYVSDKELNETLRIPELAKKIFDIWIEEKEEEGYEDPLITIDTTKDELKDIFIKIFDLH